MSGIPLTNQERTEALCRLGYNEHEAAFLCRAALHGGYFLRRQYAQFLGKNGGAVATLIEKTLAWDHAKASTYARNIHVYHLCARPFYAALGQAGNRNRRERQPLSIKNRLMGLDFVLAHPGYRYLATEQEKIEYFTRERNIDISALPAKEYRSSPNAAPASRYFVDKYPIFTRQEASGSTDPCVSFCSVDEGATTTSRFETYLNQYRNLFASLPGFEVIYVAARPLLFQAARRRFERFVTTGLGRNGGASAPDLEQLLGYFEARHLYETGDLASFDRATLIRLRDQRQLFSEPEYELAYRRWLTDGAKAVAHILASKPATRPLTHGTFSTCLLEQSYELFGSLTAF
jgi:hypothetical protein